MENKRLVELDSLRGLAALSVVFFHYLYRYNQLYGHSFEVSELFQFTYYGVHLFFIISGFVIYWTVSRCHSPLDFIWSRFSRLYPVFWVAVLFTFTVVHLYGLPGRDQGFSTLLANYLMFHEYLGFSHVDGVYWTLSIELAFYFWMLLIFSLGQIKYTERLFTVWIWMALLIKQDAFGFQVPAKAELFFLLQYIALFSLGICIYHYKFKSYTLWTHLLLVTCIISLFASYSVEIFLIFLTFVLLFFLIVFDKAMLLRNKVLVYLGSISYALYLVHQNIGYVIINEMYDLNFNPLIAITAAISTSIVLAHILMSCIELPAQKYLKSYYKKSGKMQQISERLAFLSNR